MVTLILVLVVPKNNNQTGNSCHGTPTVTDVDDNVYGTVQIGTQCWMRENLKTKHFADANTTPIESGLDTSSVDPYFYYPNGNSDNADTYGLLYNFAAVATGNICPAGWHVPSDAEWTTLTDYVSSTADYVCEDDNTIAKALASAGGEWEDANDECAVGYDQQDNNATGFTALPTGYYYGNYTLFGYNANFWSSTEYDGTGAYIRYMQYDGSIVNEYFDYKEYAYSVRRVRNY